jgi:hypothetical protein
MADTGWAFRAGADSEDVAIFAASKDFAVEVPPGIITALKRVMPEIDVIPVNGKYGLKFGMAAQLTWRFGHGDGNVGRDYMFNEWRLSLDAMERIITIVVESEVDMSEANIELFVCNWRAHLDKLAAKERNMLLITNADFVAVESFDLSDLQAVRTADLISIYDLQGVDRFFDDCAMLERACEPRLIADTRAQPKSNFNATWSIIYEATPYVAGSIEELDASAGCIVDHLKTTQWARSLNPHLVGQRAIRADLQLRLGDKTKPQRQATAIEKHLAHVLSFSPVISQVLFAGDSLPLGLAGSVDALSDWMQRLHLENSMPPDECISLNTLRAISAAWSNHLPYIRSAEVQASTPLARLEGLAALRAQFLLAAGSSAAAPLSGSAAPASAASPAAPASALGIPARFKLQAAEAFSRQAFFNVCLQLQAAFELGGPASQLDCLEIIASGGRDAVSPSPPPLSR